MNGLERVRAVSTLAGMTEVMDLHRPDADGYCPRCTRLGVGHNAGPVKAPCGAFLAAAEVVRNVARDKAIAEGALRRVPSGPNVAAR